MSMHYTIHGPRRSGLTSGLIDIAIMNAAAGVRVLFASGSGERDDRVRRLAEERCHIVGLEVGRFPASNTITVGERGGRIEFLDSKYIDRTMASGRIGMLIHDGGSDNVNIGSVKTDLRNHFRGEVW